MANFFITVDTEADNAWTSPETIEMRNFQEIPRFQELCERYNIIPAYLLTYEYATYKPAIKYLKPKAKQGKCEIGYHLHVWTTPPFDNEKDGIDLDWIHAYQFELPDNLFFKKAESLYQAIVDNFGINPLIHRAGRYGIDQRTIDWLIARNFKIDTSVVPHRSYKRHKGKIMDGPNFIGIPNNIYTWPNSDNTTEISEFPVSIVEPDILPSFIARKNPFNKVFRRFGYYKMMRPYPNNQKENIRNIKLLIKRSKNINYMLHSSELAYGCSNKTMTKEDYNKMWENLELTFKVINQKGIQSLKISQVKI